MGSDDEVRFVRVQHVALVANGIVDLDSLGFEKLAPATIFEPSEDDGLRFLPRSLVRTDDTHVKPGLLSNFFRQCFRGNSILRLVPPIHQDDGSGANAEASALMRLHFLGLRHQSELPRSHGSLS